MQDALLRETTTGDLAGFIRSDDFPCVGAKSALAVGRLLKVEAGLITSDRSDADIHLALARFGEDMAAPDVALSSLAVLFGRGPVMSETAFEHVLWNRLQALHDLDMLFGIPWAESVSSDPSDVKFSMSIGGAAYFVIGLHPGASRHARRFHRPAMIFNSHDQFEGLRRDGRYAAMQKIVRKRELQTQGSINPMVADFGRTREAAQYSGRQVDPTWACPFRKRAG